MTEGHSAKSQQIMAKTEGSKSKEHYDDNLIDNPLKKHYPDGEIPEMRRRSCAETHSLNKLIKDIDDIDINANPFSRLLFVVSKLDGKISDNAPIVGAPRCEYCEKKYSMIGALFDSKEAQNIDLLITNTDVSILTINEIVWHLSGVR